MKSLVAAACAAMVSVAAASAQPFPVPGAEQGSSAFGPEPVMQITTTFRTRIEGVADGREVPAPTAQDAARRMLYNMASNECTILAEYWKGECRLNSFSVYAAPEDLGPNARAEAPSMFGTAVYEIRQQSPGR